MSNNRERMSSQSHMTKKLAKEQQQSELNSKIATLGDQLSIYMHKYPGIVGLTGVTPEKRYKDLLMYDDEGLCVFDEERMRDINIHTIHDRCVYEAVGVLANAGIGSGVLEKYVRPLLGTQSVATQLMVELEGRDLLPKDKHQSHDTDATRELKSSTLLKEAKIALNNLDFIVALQALHDHVSHAKLSDHEIWNSFNNVISQIEKQVVADYLEHRVNGDKHNQFDFSQARELVNDTQRILNCTEKLLIAQSDPKAEGLSSLEQKAFESGLRKYQNRAYEFSQYPSLIALGGAMATLIASVLERVKIPELIPLVENLKSVGDLWLKEADKSQKIGAVVEHAKKAIKKS